MRRVALVTGGTRGIGFGVASALAGDGFDLAVCGRRAVDDVEGVLQTLRTAGSEVLYCRTDVSCERDRAVLLEQVESKFGALHVLVNNAGVAPLERQDLLSATEESFERVLRINLQGPYFLTQAVAHRMISQRQQDKAFYGCIVNIGSVSAEVVSVNRGEYCVSKAGLTMMTRLFASRLGEYGIPVYEVRPGIIHSDMTERVKDTYDVKIAETDLLIQKRWGEPEDVGRAVAMLARGDLPYSTGQIIGVDGGLSVQRL